MRRRRAGCCRLRRVGGDSQPLVGDALASFVRDRSRRSAEEELLNRRFDPADFDIELVNSALARNGRPSVVGADLDSPLVDLHLAERASSAAAGGGIEVTTAAAVL